MSEALLELAHTITDNDGIHVPFFRVEGKDVTVHNLLATALASVAVTIWHTQRAGLVRTRGSIAVDRLQHSHVSGRDVYSAFQELEDQENKKLAILVYAALD